MIPAMIWDLQERVPPLDGSEAARTFRWFHWLNLELMTRRKAVPIGIHL
jgi:hypothetical protein